MERDGIVGAPGAEVALGVVAQRTVGATCDVVAVLDFDSDLSGDYDDVANAVGERLANELIAIGCPPIGPMWTKSVGGRSNGYSSVAVMIGYQTSRLPEKLELSDCVIDIQVLAPRKEAFVILDVHNSDGSAVNAFLDFVGQFDDSDGSIRTQPVVDDAGNYLGRIECSAVIEWL